MAVRVEEKHMTQGNELLALEASEGFVMTPYLERIVQRTLAYLEAGYPVHLSGPAGTGKTTLALHLAALRGRPIVLLYGDEDFGSSDLTGRDKGVVSRRVVDNFVRSVLKTEESVRSQWVDHRLTTACKNGATLVYDEFSRSHAEANNALLSILQEGLLALPGGRNGGYVKVHPQFRAILTSNPDEYAGVYTPQSALLDRMITFHMAAPECQTEVEITRARSGLSQQEAERIVALVAAARQRMSGTARTSLRMSIMIARLVRHCSARVSPEDGIFAQVCADVLGAELGQRERLREIFDEVFVPGGPEKVRHAYANLA